MIKTLAAANKSEREPFKIPRSVQQSIPIQRVFRDGIWQTGRNRYSRTWRFADINYSVASHEDQQEMFLACPMVCAASRPPGPSPPRAPPF